GGVRALGQDAEGGCAAPLQKSLPAAMAHSSFPSSICPRCHVPRLQQGFAQEASPGRGLDTDLMQEERGEPWHCGVLGSRARTGTASAGFPHGDKKCLRAGSGPALSAGVEEKWVLEVHSLPC
uniref:Uncharacterized protein n=1 Tax=Anas platyrhynchos TaxID=8839 RepID=A0A8B9T774_ANAPL